MNQTSQEAADCVCMCLRSEVILTRLHPRQIEQRFDGVAGHATCNVHCKHLLTVISRAGLRVGHEDMNFSDA